MFELSRQTIIYIYIEYEKDFVSERTNERTNEQINETYPRVHVYTQCVRRGFPRWVEAFMCAGRVIRSAKLASTTRKTRRVIDVLTKHVAWAPRGVGTPGQGILRVGTLAPSARAVSAGGGCDHTSSSVSKYHKSLKYRVILSALKPPKTNMVLLSFRRCAVWCHRAGGGLLALMRIQ